VLATGLPKLPNVIYSINSSANYQQAAYGKGDALSDASSPAPGEAETELMYSHQ